MFFALTPDNAEEFFKRCLEKEAVTLVERLQIMKDLIDEQKVLVAGELTPKVEEACQAYFDKTKHRGMIFLKEKNNVPKDPDSDNR